VAFDLGPGRWDLIQSCAIGKDGRRIGGLAPIPSRPTVWRRRGPASAPAPRTSACPPAVGRAGRRLGAPDLCPAIDGHGAVCQLRRKIIGLDVSDESDPIHWGLGIVH